MTDSSFDPAFPVVAIIGPGLLGGSLARALRRYQPETEVRLWGRRRAPLDVALGMGAAHLVSMEMAEVVSGADLVVLATPVGVMPGVTATMLPFLKEGVVVTDVGSVKSCVHEHVGKVLTSAGIRFVGSHPMAGSENQGMEFADPELFRGATCIETNDEHVSEDVLLAVQRFWECVGCHCVRMESAIHDISVARISHIPHTLAALCVHCAMDDGDVERLGLISAGGFRDTTRVSMGEPAMWAEILCENAPAVLARLDVALAQLTQVRAMLAEGNSADLATWLAQAGESRRRALNL